jgi:hypothetical protein
MNSTLESSVPLQRPSNAKSAGDWIKETRLLKQLEVVKAALEYASELGSFLSFILMVLSVLAGCFACGFCFAKFIGLAATFGGLSSLFSVLSYCYWPVHSEKMRRVEDAIKTLGGEFPDELRAWGSEPALRSAETVDFLIRTQRARIAQAEAEACGSIGPAESRTESHGQRAIIAQPAEPEACNPYVSKDSRPDNRGPSSNGSLYMNDTQRTVLFWTLVAVSFFLHFSFLNWNGSYPDFLWFTSSDRGRVSLYLFLGLVVPAGLVGTGTFILYGNPKK